MKTTYTILLIIMICATMQAADTLTILHVNDTHSNLAPGGPRDEHLRGTIGGIARAASVIGATRSTETNVLTLHAGDLYVGDLFFQKYYGVAELQLMAMMGFDAMAVGNHEFDLTPFVLQQALDTAFKSSIAFPLLSANTILSNDSVAGLRRYIKPYTVATVNKLKIGIFGLTTPSTNILSLPAPAIIDTNFIPLAAQMVDSLRALHCDVIICLSHLGITFDKAVAENVPGIDLIVGGHDHYLFERAINVTNSSSNKSVPIVQAGSFYKSIGKVQLEIGGNGVRLLESSVIALDKSIPEEPSVASIIDELMKEIESTYGMVYTQKLAEADEDFEEVANNLSDDGAHDTPIGNLVSDAYREFGKTDLGLQPGGATAQQLYKGPQVAADAFRINGYGFNTANGLGYRMATCTLTGLDIITGLEFGLATIEENDEYLLQCSGMTYTYDPTSTPFSRVHSVLINGAPIDPAKTYSVTINEFVVGFLSFVNIVPQNVQLHNDSTEFHVMSAYMAAHPSLQAKREGRVRAISGSTEVATSALQTDGIAFFPNPSQDRAELHLSVPKSAHLKVVIYDLNLQEVQCAYDSSVDSGDVRVPIDTSMLSRGSYYVKCLAGEKTYLHAFVVR